MDLGIATVMSALIVVVGTILVALVKEVGKTADRAEEDGGRLYAEVGGYRRASLPAWQGLARTRPWIHDSTYSWFTAYMRKSQAVRQHIRT
jgi:hypothetical protein